MTTLIIVLAILIGFYYFKKGNYKTKFSTNFKSKSKTESKKSKNSDFFDILVNMKKDFIQDPYVDKLKANDNIYSYTFMNGDLLFLDLSSLILPILKMKTHNKTKIININTNQAKIFADLFLQIVNSATTRTSNSRYSQFKTSYETKTGKLYTDSQLKEQKTYDKLVRIYNLRKNQLNTMNSSNPNRNNLENELNVVENKLKKIKPKTGL